jgi:transcriptional regulatory protein RtcR
VAGDFVEVNCATLRGDAAMSALFGHVKGSFTGAITDRDGLLKRAHNGIAFLDEIGELGLDEQAMLLRALEEKTFRPMGSDREIKSDFQLMAGTNRDLAQRVAERTFREDLLARIELWTFKLPSLRERPEDIEPNLDWELELCARSLGVRITMNREARARFVAFATSHEALWTGNFRDFSAAVVRMATLSHGGRIDLAVVEEEISLLKSRWNPSPSPPPTATILPTGNALLNQVLKNGCDSIDRFDRAQLIDVIQVCRSCATLSAAGRELFSVSRTTRTSANDADRLRKYLLRHGLTWESVREPFKL